MRGCAGQPPLSGVTSMKVRDLHSWDVSPTEARRIQSELRGRLQLVDDRPTIGCAKSRLVGSYQEPAREFGAHTPLIDRGEQVGAAVRTRPSHAPLFVSPGHKISLETAVALALACCREGRFMPEPT